MRRPSALPLDDHGIVLLAQERCALELDLMAGPPRFGLEVVAVPLRGRDHMRDAARDIPSELFQLLNLARVVRHQVNGTDVEACQHVRRDLVVTLVVPEPKGDVAVHRVEPLARALLGGDLVDDTYSAALRPHGADDPDP